MEKSKIIYSTALIMVLLILAVIPVQAAQYPKIIISGYSINGGEAGVGHNFILSLNLTNIESMCAMTTTTNVQANPPFINRGASTITAGTICGGETKTVNIPLAIDPTATGGTYQLSITNNYETSVYTHYSSSDRLNIFVNGSPDINARIVNSVPVDVYSGDSAVLSVNIENTGTFAAQNLNATLSSDSPLIVKWANSQVATGTLSPKQSKIAEFSIEVPKDESAQTYPLVLSVNYLDENLAMQTKKIPFEFTVKKKATFTTSDAGSDSLAAGEDERIVRVTIKNNGNDIAKNLKIRLIPQFPFSTDGSIRYINRLKPGESAPIDFVTYVDKDATLGTYGLDALVNFEDASKNKLSDTTTVSLLVVRKSFFRAVFLDFWFLWVLAIVIATIIISKKKAKKKK